MKFAFVLFTVLVLCYTAVSDTRETGVVACVGQRGITSVVDSIIPLSVAKLLNATIPDITQRTHVSVIGEVEVSLKNTKMEQFSVKNASIITQKPTTLIVSAKGISFHATTEWHYKKLHGIPKVSDSGHGRISSSSTDVAVSVALGGDTTTGRPKATITQCKVAINNLDISLSGGASWLYNVLISLFKGSIENAISKTICKDVSDSIQPLIDKTLATVPIQQPIGNGLAVDYGLSKDSVVVDDNGSLSLSSVGEFYAEKKGPGYTPGTPSAMTLSGKVPMIEVLISEWTLQSVSTGSLYAGILSLAIDKDNAPAVAAAFFVSGFYKDNVPGLVSRYGFDDDMSMIVSASTAPKVYITSASGATVKASALLEFFAKNTTTGKFDFTFSVTLDIQLSAQISVKNNNITGELTVESLTAKVGTSSVGQINIDGINEIFNFVAAMGVDLLNEQLDDGIPLPSVAGLNYINPQITFKDGFLSVSSDIHWDPSI